MNHFGATGVSTLVSLLGRCGISGGRFGITLVSSSVHFGIIVGSSGVTLGSLRYQLRFEIAGQRDRVIDDK